MCELTDHAPARDALAAAGMAPVVRLEYPAQDEGLLGLESLPDSFKAELVEMAERGQVRG